MEELSKFNVEELKSICRHYNLRIPRKKADIIETIKEFMKEKGIDEKVKHNVEKTMEKKDRKKIENKDIKDINISKKSKENSQYIDGYKIIRKLGNKGKEATTYLVKDDRGDKYAMKTYRKNKPGKKIKEEYEMQAVCYRYGISPKVYKYSEKDKYIIMEIMDYDLVDLIKYYDGKLPMNIQKKIIDIFGKLDNLKIFHGDPNPLNIMFSNNNKSPIPYIIDFGFSEKFNEKLYTKHKTEDLNMYYMPSGLLIYLKKPFPKYKFSHIEKYCDKFICDKLHQIK